MKMPRAHRLIRVPYVSARRWLYLGLVMITTGTGTLMMLDIVRAAGVTALEVGILALFMATFGWISTSFWNAVLGFGLQMLDLDPLTLRRVRDSDITDSPIQTRTALVMPAHNEDPARLIGGLSAIMGSLEKTGQADCFDLHLLSDTTVDETARVEESAWRKLRAMAPRPERLHYRRRPVNVGRKAGNLADFCTHHGASYDFMVVLDADSIMSGATLVELVLMMQANPEAGLIQTVPIPARQETLFGRLIQFAAAVYSPMLAWGQSFWQTDTANYWGHNAIVRTRPFMEHCRLPVLPGKPPLGGAILSHDFVEAALLRRAGWKVYLLPWLGGSYEEVPANVFDYAKRDRRWAQGSLQHLRLLFERGLEPVNRIHFLLGAMGYVSSVLWLLILLASSTYVLLPGVGIDPLIGSDAVWLSEWSLRGARAVLPLLALTGIVLFLPKALGVVLALTKRRREFGGSGSVVLSSLGEAVFAAVIAPVMMIYHTLFVASIVGGRDVDWGAQPRVGRNIPWKEALTRTRGITGIGMAWAGLTLYSSPTFFIWLTPIFLGLLLAAPLARVTSSASVGLWLRKRGILLAPSEAHCPPELDRTDERAQRDIHRFSNLERVHLEAGNSELQMTAPENIYDAERGLFDLRKGRPVFVTPSDKDASEGAMLVAAAEGLDGATLDILRRLGSDSLRLIVTDHRARAMGIPFALPGEALPLSVSLALNGEAPPEIFRLSSALGPFDVARLDPRKAAGMESAGLALTRLGKLLPAAVCVRADPSCVPELRQALDSGMILQVRSTQISGLTEGPQPPVEVTYVSDAPVPLAEAENVRFMLFREGNGLLEHVAVIIGDQSEWPDPVPVRLHSACLTGDLFGSLRCDCGEQLRGSLQVFASSGGGVLLYLEQEGRGIGLGNKLRAYALQQEGLDTVDSDCVLGFGADERRYDAAVEILRQLGIERVQLLTNNPEKMKALEAGGIRVVDRQPLHGTLNRHNLPYVRAKVQRAGHWLGDMLHGAIPGK